VVCDKTSKVKSKKIDDVYISSLIKQTYKIIMGNIEEKKVGVAGLQPPLISLDYSKLIYF